jgi:uncharacterized protein
MYFNGDGMEKDIKKAVYYYSEAVEKEDLHACWSLGGLYQEGNGVPKNLSKAYELFKKRC